MVSPWRTSLRVEKRQPKSLTSSMKVRSFILLAAPSISVTSTGICTNTRLSALFSLKNILVLLFSSGTLLPQSFHFIQARAVPKKCLYGPGNKRFAPVFATPSFHNEKCVPKRDAINSYRIGSPPLGRLALAFRGEVRRTGSKIGTSAPRADSGRLFGRETCRVI